MLFHIRHNEKLQYQYAKPYGIWDHVGSWILEGTKKKKKIVIIHYALETFKMWS